MTSSMEPVKPKQSNSQLAVTPNPEQQQEKRKDTQCPKNQLPLCQEKLMEITGATGANKPPFKDVEDSDVGASIVGICTIFSVPVPC